MVRRGRAAALVAIVRADPTLFPRRTAIVFAVAIVAGIGVVLGCASEASARRGAARIGQVQNGRASYYGKEFNWRRTASGERYDPNGMTAAHKTLPFGTRVRVTRKGGGPSVVLRVNDRCGCTHGRIIDVSQAAAHKLDMLKVGVVPVRLEVVP
jgi:rare lipoprotein A